MKAPGTEGVKKKFPHLPELDGIRGLAALAVFFDHFFQFWNPEETTHFPHWIGWIAKVSSFGYLGVDVFFGLSGFLITSLLLVDRESPAFFHNFYWKRVLRILPVYLVHLAVAAVMLKDTLGYILLSSVFLVNFAGLFHVNVVGAAWTLSIEEQFYLLWPQAVRRLRLQTVYSVAFGLVAMSVLGRAAVELWHGAVNLNYTFYRCDGLALGALLALQWYSHEGQTRWVRAALRVLNSNGTLLAVAAGYAAMLVWLPRSAMTNVAMLTAVNYGVYRLIRLVLALRQKGAKALAWLGSPVGVYLGAISYALYMYQSFVFILFAEHGPHPAPTDGLAIVREFAITLAVCLVVCTVSRFALELPVLRLRRFVLR
jgi:peptidoglycan/LPS O-acetylase OafA/YrhL